MRYSKAYFSKDRIYRYVLERCWHKAKPAMMIIGLNPSTADEVKNDPTVTRCINYAKSWGYGGIYMMNLFAFRATDPKEMLNQDDPVGPKNDEWLIKIAKRSRLILCAWGNHGVFENRDVEIECLLREHSMYCLKINKSGTPKHPLYCKGDLKPIIYPSIILKGD